MEYGKTYKVTYWWATNRRDLTKTEELVFKGTDGDKSMWDTPFAAQAATSLSPRIALTIDQIVELVAL